MRGCIKNTNSTINAILQYVAIIEQLGYYLIIVYQLYTWKPFKYNYRRKCGKYTPSPKPVYHGK